MSLIPENDKNPYNHNSFHRAPPIRKLFSQSTEDCDEDLKSESATFQVYLRIKPNPDYKNTIKILSGSRLLCKPPIISKGYKSTEKVEFTFSKIFGPETNQQEVFEEAVLPCVNDLVRSHSSVIFSYGTTNAGKTYTIQGDMKSPGLIPRTLHATFSRLIPDEEVKYAPQFAFGIKRLNITESTNELIKKEDILRLHASMKSSKGVYPSEFYDEYSQLSQSFEDYSDNQINSVPTCTVWVSFIEIYNETIFDLLEPCTGNPRPQLKLSADHNKQYYIKGLKQFCVQNAAEAYSIYLYGKKNLSVACTKMNENSSRSHCLFIIKVLNQSDPEFVTISSLTICDLAGTERQTKAQNTGVRLKESGNINLSLFTLNRCLKTLRENQAGNTNQVMPYRSSKLTQLLSSALLDRNEVKVIMIVNINPSQELYDETQQVLKVCAFACEIKNRPVKSARIVRRQTRFSTFVYERDNEVYNYQPFELEMSDCEEENNESSEDMQRQINQLNEELKKNKEHIERMHQKYQEMLQDSSKFHDEEVEQIRKELKESSERRIQSIKDYYEWKLKEVSQTDKNDEPEIPSAQEDPEMKNKMLELEFELSELKLQMEDAAERAKKLSELEAENIRLKQEMLKLNEKEMDLRSLLNEAKEDRKAIDKENEALASKLSVYREQNKVYQLNVDSLEKTNEELEKELELKDKELCDKSNHIQYLEKLIGDKENKKTKKRNEKKKKLYNPDEEALIFSPEEYNSDRDIFREKNIFSLRTEKIISAALLSGNEEKSPLKSRNYGYTKFDFAEQARPKNEVATPAMAIKSHRKKKLN